MMHREENDVVNLNNALSEYLKLNLLAEMIDEQETHCIEIRYWPEIDCYVYNVIFKHSIVPVTHACRNLDFVLKSIQSSDKLSITVLRWYILNIKGKEQSHVR